MTFCFPIPATVYRSLRATWACIAPRKRPVFQQTTKTLLFVVLVASLAAAQDSVYLTLSADNSFVVTSEGIDLSGLNFESPSGSLRTAPFDPPTPFSFHLANQPDSIVYGAVPGTGVRLEGSLQLDSGWDPSGEKDVVFEFAILNNPATFSVPLSDDFYDGAIPSALPQVSINGERVLRVDNVTDPIKSFTFQARAGLLEGIEFPADWNVTERSDTLITFTADRSIEPRDLGLMAVSWNSSFDNNVFVSFTIDDGSSFGPFPMGARAVPEPASATLLFVAGLGILTMRRRG